MIFDLYANKLYSLYGIRDYLDAQKVPKPAKGDNHKAISGKGKWSTGTIGNILGNECYVGRWYYRKTKKVKDPKSGKYRQVARPREEWIRINVPAIVPEALFQAAQKRREANKHQKVNNQKHNYLLGGMLKCEHCGNGMSGTTKFYNGKGYGYYRCNARHIPKKYGFKSTLNSKLKRWTVQYGIGFILFLSHLNY